jgi:peptidoglycan hydrolase-like protein with peptidoglycan-binding domain
MLRSPIARVAAVLALVLGVGVGMTMAVVTAGNRGVSNEPASAAPPAGTAPSPAPPAPVITAAPATVGATVTVAPPVARAPAPPVMTVAGALSPTVAIVASAPSPAAPVAAAASSPVARAAAGATSPVANASPAITARAPSGSPTVGNDPAAKPQVAGSLPTVRPGAESVQVVTLQYLLRQHGANIEPEANFTPETEAAVRDFQRQHGLRADGVVGPPTWAALFVPVKRGDRGEAVSAVQHRLSWDGFLGDIDGTPEIDGVFGDQTEAAVRACQEANGLPADGIVGPQTWAALLATG